MRELQYLMPKIEIKDWYEHAHPQSVFVMFTKTLEVVWSLSGNELRRVYLLDPDAYSSGPLELPIPDELRAVIDEAIDNF